MPNAAQQNSLPRQFILGGLFVWGYMQTSPLIFDEQLRWFPVIFALFAGLIALDIVNRLLMLLAGCLDWASSHQPTGKEGTASWATYKDMKPELLRKKQGPFWGLTAERRGKPLFIDYASNAMSVAPAGSGKGIYTVITNALSIKYSKVLSDFKGELVCILKKPLEARGEKVRVLNPGNLWRNIIGASDTYNPLDIIVDDLHRPGGLRDVPDDLREETAQILPEPSEGKSDDSYWREGAHRITADAILLEVMIEEFDATLSSVALPIEDRKALEHNLRWIIGIDLKGKPLPDGPLPIEQTT